MLKLKKITLLSVLALGLNMSCGRDDANDMASSDLADADDGSRTVETFNAPFGVNCTAETKKIDCGNVKYLTLHQTRSKTVEVESVKLVYDDQDGKTVKEAKGYWVNKDGSIDKSKVITFEATYRRGDKRTLLLVAGVNQTRSPSSIIVTSRTDIGNDPIKATQGRGNLEIRVNEYSKEELAKFAADRKAEMAAQVAADAKTDAKAKAKAAAEKAQKAAEAAKAAAAEAEKLAEEASKLDQPKAAEEAKPADQQKPANEPKIAEEKKD